ncbi:Exlusion protein FxsA [uncultured Gammaproteobacteria bacterium]
MPVLFAFVVIPLIEIAVFAMVGQMLGLWPTLALALGLGAFGAMLLRRQGLATMRRMMAKMEHGNAAFGEVIEGIWLVLAGLLLLTPGFVTDLVGLLLFVPVIRRRLGRWLVKFILDHGQINVMVDGQSVPVSEADIQSESGSGPGPGSKPEVEILPPLDSKWGSDRTRFRS